MTLENTAEVVPETEAAVELTRAPETPARPSVSWGTRLLAFSGFLLAGAILGLYLSQEVAVEKARNYLRTKYKAEVDVPIKTIQPALVEGPTSSGKPLPPLGLCWNIIIETGVAEGEVLVNPWNHEVVDWRVDALDGTFDLKR